MKRSILVVGAGFAGACYARRLAERNFDVTVIDRRDHIGGNAFDFVDENGVRRHQYGPHIFHTSSAFVFDWLSRFTEWASYEHRVRARLSDGRYVPVPINLDTVNTVFAKKFDTPQEVADHLDSIAVKVEHPRTAADYLYSRLGVELTDLFFRPYTKKMWALDLEEMSPAVVQRIPIRFDREDRYFPDEKFQFMPVNGYTALFERILDHPGIRYHTSTHFDKTMERDFIHIFNSMPIDEYYDYELGELPYRSVRFHHATSTVRPNHAWATSNFTDDGPRTRATMWCLFPQHVVSDTGRYTYTEEEPCDYRDNNFERYYPVKTADNRFDEIYGRYKARSAAEGKTTFIGRCGTYQYLDMHQVINQSLRGADAWALAHG